MVAPDRRETEAWLRLAFGARLPAGVAVATARRWAGTCRSMAELFEADESELRVLELTPRRLAAVRHAAPIDQTLIAPVLAAGIGLLPCTARDYPPLLDRAAGYAPPPLLTWRGDLQLLHRPAAAIVGSRDACEESLVYARKLAGWLARAHVNVVSGDARGVDRAAHAGAAERGGPTTGVLPMGLLTHEGNPHLNLVLSPFEPWAPMLPRRALARNGLISALSICLVVIEARAVGGTWNAANQALRHGRTVLVRPCAEAGNKLLLERGGRPLPSQPLAAAEVVMRHLEQAPSPPPEDPRLPGL